MAAVKYWLWLSSLPGLGPRAAAKIAGHFNSPKAAYFADGEEYSLVPGISANEAKLLKNKSMERAYGILTKCLEQNVRIITMQDAAYPARLRNIADPPTALYIKGALPNIDDEAAIALVGTRNASAYGLKTAERIAYEAAKCGGIIVTGLAAGADSAAARGALLAGGRVVGVLGCGLDIVYPKINRSLFEDVAASGALVSEYPPGTQPLPSNFPARNRIVSGMSVGVAVIEAPVKSGALITASLALEQGRDVFAVPGNVDSPASEGANALLREGAELITSGADIMSVYEPLFPDRVNVAAVRRPAGERREERIADGGPDSTAGSVAEEKSAPEIDNRASMDYIGLEEQLSGLSEDELAVVSAMTYKGMHADDITEASGLPVPKVLSVLTMLEIKGFVRQDNGKRFSLKISKK